MSGHKRTHHRPQQRAHQFADPGITSLVTQGDAAAADRLVTIANGDDARRAKEARRALYVLSQHGIRPTTQTGPASPEPITRTQKRGLPCAAVSLLSPSGQRVVAFAERPDSAPLTLVAIGPLRTVVRVTSSSFTIAELTARTMPWYGAESPFAAQIPADYARHVVHEAAHQTRNRGELMPVGLSDALQQIGDPSEPVSRHPAYTAIGADPRTLAPVPSDAHVRASYIAALRDLADPDARQNLVTRLRQMQDSPLLLHPDQYREMLDRAFVQAVPLLYPPDLQLCVPQWILDDALVWHHAGRPKEAAECLKLADDCSAGSAAFLSLLRQAAVASIAADFTHRTDAAATGEPSPIVTLDDLAAEREQDELAEPRIWRPGMR